MIVGCCNDRNLAAVPVDVQVIVQPVEGVVEFYPVADVVAVVVFPGILYDLFLKERNPEKQLITVGW